MLNQTEVLKIADNPMNIVAIIVALIMLLIVTIVVYIVTNELNKKKIYELNIYKEEMVRKKRLRKAGKM